MLESVHGADARQQLREELLARAWAMHRIVANPPIDGMPAAAAEERAVVAADSWSALLCGSTPTVRHRTAALIERMLWPTFRPAAEWWTTPLGEALLMARSVPCPTATKPTRRRGTSDELVAVNTGIR